MNIVIDIDDTIVDETGFMIKKAPKYLKRYGIKPEIQNPHGYNLAEIFGLEQHFQRQGEFRREEIAEKCKAIENGFWNRYFFLYTFRPCKGEKTINALKKAGIHIYFVSCRGKKTKEADTLFNRFLRLKIVPFLTAMQLKRNFIKYNQLKIVENEDEKLEFIKKIHAQFVFDDQMSILRRLPEFSRAVCVSTLHNICESDDRIFKVSSLADCLILETILKDYKRAICRKEPPIKCFRRKCTDLFYILNRHLWKKLLVRKFRPIVYGAENIPNDKRAVIYVGNHRNNFDPVIATLYLKRPVHWCALLRLFEAKENLFGRDDIYFLRKLSSWFIKAIGALPIARPTDENCQKINLSTLLKADEYLKRGNSIGFFPEGTINRRPEEVDLLPVASDAVFRLAIRNSCWLQPFSIVWMPQLGIHNKVIISYTEAIETTGMNAREVRSLWEQAVKGSIERVNQAVNDSTGCCVAQVSDRQKRDCDA